MSDIKSYAHQTTTTNFILDHPRCYVANDPGTGKTKACIDAVVRQGFRALILCPLSIMEPSWGMDIRKFTKAQFTIAHGPKHRSAALKKDVQFVITNHDAVSWLIKEPKSVIQAFDILIVDECTAFKNRTTKRSKGLLQIANLIESVVIMSGTPNTNKITDLWHQYFMLDRGERLGRSFQVFQNQMCIGEVQHMAGRRFTKWIDRPDAPELVHEKVKDITIRFKFEDCISIPDNQLILKELTMPPFILQKYVELRDEQVLVHDGSIVNPIHAGSRVKKLLQLLSGAVYDEEGNVVKVHTDRYELVMDLVAEREQCLVGFNWKHEVQALVEIAERRKIPYAVIDGSVKVADREVAVREFQKGNLQVIFAHPQSAGHGLTLTNGSATIWCSPTYNAEHYQQFNRRIYRAGQTQKTQTIRVAYTDSKEVEVYAALDGKLERMEDLLTLLNQEAANDEHSPNDLSRQTRI